MLAYHRGGWENTMWHLALTCWSVQMSPKQVWSNIWWHGSPPVFSV
jgi:hypothetical protein